jgi:hypothetical protein
MTQRDLMKDTEWHGFLRKGLLICDWERAYFKRRSVTAPSRARGHVDCLEIVTDQALAQAIPIVRVTHPLAKVTHEAAIGNIDQKQLETLMAHGLTPEQAVELVFSGMLS